MKCSILLVIALLGFLFGGCSQEDEKIRKEIEQIAEAGDDSKSCFLKGS